MNALMMCYNIVRAFLAVKMTEEYQIGGCIMREVDMPGKYDSASVEAGRYDKWVQEKRFKPSGNDKARPYSIVIPPPNVTGKLHLGHAWDTTLQDMLIRQKRMQGFDTLWLPGMDHAGIATQAKVEQRLANKDFHVTISVVKSSSIKCGTGRTNMLQRSSNNGVS